MGGSGYTLPLIGDGKGKKVANADGETIIARINPETDTHYVFPGATTVLRQLDKAALAQWRADSVAARAVANVDAILSRTPEEGFTYLRFAADEVLNDAAEQGTAIHEYIQADLGFGFYPDIDTQNLEDMVIAWDQFKFEHDIRNVRWAERTLGNLEEGYMATADLWWDIDDMPNQLVDLKSSRSTWDDQMAQAASMANCTTQYYEDDEGWHEDPFEQPESVSLVHIRPDDFDTKGNFIPAFAKLIVIEQEDLPLYMGMFRGALTAAKSRYELKKRAKQREKELIAV